MKTMKRIKAALLKAHKSGGLSFLTIQTLKAQALAQWASEYNTILTPQNKAAIYAKISMMAEEIAPA